MADPNKIIPMKFNKCSRNALLGLFALSVLFITCSSSLAQTVTNANPFQFFVTAETWLTSANTNLTWAGTEMELAVGADYQNSLQWANTLDAQYDVKGGDFGLGARIRNAGVAGVVEQYQGKVEYSFLNYYDLRGEGCLYFGYDHQYKTGVVEPQINLRKLMTAATFAGIYIGEPIRFRQHGVPNPWVPNIGVETGVGNGGVYLTPSPVAMRAHFEHALTHVRHLLDPHQF